MPGGVRGGSAPPTGARGGFGGAAPPRQRPTIIHHPSSIFLYNYYCYNWGVKPPNKIINTTFSIIYYFQSRLLFFRAFSGCFFFKWSIFFALSAFFGRFFFLKPVFFFCSSGFFWPLFFTTTITPLLLLLLFLKH